MAQLPLCFRYRSKEEVESYLGTYEYYSLVEMSNKSNLPAKAWQNLTISVPKEDLEAYRLCNMYKEDIVNQVSMGAGLFIYGGVGSGKTVWAYKIARHYMEIMAGKLWDEKTTPVYFANVPRLLDDLRVAMKDAEATKILDHKMMNSDLVIFDDLGAENATSWAKDKLYQYIDYRYANAKACVFTSNIHLESLEPRIADRIKGSCTQIEFKMESKRKFGVLGGN